MNPQTRAEVTTLGMNRTMAFLGDGGLTPRAPDRPVQARDS